MTKSKYNAICVIIAAILLLAANNAQAQSVVMIKSDGELGQGLAVKRGEECFVITPKHVLGNDPEPKVISPTEGSIILEYVNTTEVAFTIALNDEQNENFREDLSLLKSSGAGRQICSDNLKQFESERRSFVPVSDGKGEIPINNINLLGAPNETILFEFESRPESESQPKQAMKSMSGAPIMWGGKLVGLVVRLSTDPSDKRQIGYDINLVAQRFGDWVLGRQIDVIDAERALSVLQRVRSMLPSSDIGQVKALKALATGGTPLSGLDLKGFYFDRARFLDYNFTGSDFTGATFNEGVFSKSTFPQAIFDFAVARSVQMDGVMFVASSHAFADYDSEGRESNFSDANFTRANLIYATFRGAKLVNTNFTNANLTYADFTGADITGADFTNAILNGAIFKDVIGLDKATFKNSSVTNTVGATSRAFSDDEVCGYNISHGGFDSVRVVQKTPSPRFDDGFKYDNILRYTPTSSYNHTPATIIGMAHFHFLRPCDDRLQGSMPAKTETNIQARSLSFDVERFFHRDFLSKRDLKKYIKTRVNNRVSETIRAHQKRDFIIPRTRRDDLVAQKIRQKTTNIETMRSVCIRNGLYDFNLLMAMDRNSDYRGSILDEIVEVVERSANAHKSIQSLKTRKGLTVKHKIVWPFGDLGSEIPKSHHLNLGPATIASYRTWKEKVLKHSEFALCRASSRVSEFYQIFNDLGVVEDYEKGHAWVTVAREKIKKLNKKPDFVGNIAWGQDTHAVGFYLDRVPATEILAKEYIPLKENKQLRLKIKIRDVSVDSESRFVKVYANFLGESEVDIGTIASDPTDNIGSVSQPTSKRPAQSLR